MHRSYTFICVILALGMLSGCSPLEVVRSFWGSSTRRLEIERANAERNTYNCSFNACFDAVVSMEGYSGLDSEDKEASASGQNKSILDGGFTSQGIVNSEIKLGFEIFLKNRVKGVIVVMKVPGNVDTTEVGIFFSRVRTDETTIEVTSLSTSAKLKVAEYIHENLTKKFR